MLPESCVGLGTRGLLEGPHAPTVRSKAIPARSHALRRAAAVDRLIAAPMARTTTATRRQERRDTREASSSNARHDVPRAQSQASCRGGARGPARCRRGEGRVQRRRPSSEEPQLAAIASRVQRPTSPVAPRRGWDRSIPGDSLTKSLAESRTIPSPDGRLPSTSARSLSRLGARSKDPSREAGAAPSKRATSIRVQRRAATGR